MSTYALNGLASCRKPHYCEVCMNKTCIGDILYYELVVCDNRIFYEYYHPDCYDDLGEIHCH